jgi:hypothetical protein
VIRPQREREVELLAERSILFRRVEADADDRRVQVFELVGLITQALALNRSAGSIGFRVPPQHDPATSKIAEPNLVAVVVACGEIGSSRFLGEHDAILRRVLAG